MTFQHLLSVLTTSAILVVGCAPAVGRGEPTVPSLSEYPEIVRPALSDPNWLGGVSSYLSPAPFTASEAEEVTEELRKLAAAGDARATVFLYHYDDQRVFQGKRRAFNEEEASSRNESIRRAAATGYQPAVCIQAQLAGMDSFLSKAENRKRELQEAANASIFVEVVLSVFADAMSDLKALADDGDAVAMETLAFTYSGYSTGFEGSDPRSTHTRKALEKLSVRYYRRALAAGRGASAVFLLYSQENLSMRILRPKR